MTVSALDVCDATSVKEAAIIRGPNEILDARCEVRTGWTNHKRSPCGRPLRREDAVDTSWRPGVTSGDACGVIDVRCAAGCDQVRDHRVVTGKVTWRRRGLDVGHVGHASVALARGRSTICGQSATVFATTNATTIFTICWTAAFSTTTTSNTDVVDARQARQTLTLVAGTTTLAGILSARRRVGIITNTRRDHAEGCAKSEQKYQNAPVKPQAGMHSASLPVLNGQ
jgi:hypothetical protein